MNWHVAAPAGIDLPRWTVLCDRTTRSIDILR
jgi:hypothetical protein